MRKGSAFVLTVASCSALVGAWRIGNTHGMPTAASVSVVAPPALLMTGAPQATPTPTTTPLPTATSDPSTATATTSATATASTTKRPPAAGAATTHPPTAHPTTTRPPTPKPTPTPTPTQRTARGAVVQTPYGDVQVEVTVLGARLLNVTALRLTDSSSLSVSISAHAAPILRSEALAAQSSHIHAVSGASYTSQGYILSLQSALDAARAAA